MTTAREANIRAQLASMAERGRTRTVRGVAGAAYGRNPVGRPRVMFEVSLVQREARLSFRRRVLAYLSAQGSRAASITELEQRFGPKVKGAIQKLALGGWVRVTRQGGAS